MSRHRAARRSRRWLSHALAGSATAAGIAFVVAFGEWSPGGALVQPFHDQATATARSCVPTSSTTAEGRTWHGCWPTYVTPPDLPRSSSAAPSRTTPTPSSTTPAETPPEAVLPTADPFAEEN